MGHKSVFVRDHDDTTSVSRSAGQDFTASSCVVKVTSSTSAREW